MDILNYFFCSAVFWNEEPEPEFRLIETPRPLPVKFISHVPDDCIEDIQLLKHITVTIGALVQEIKEIINGFEDLGPCNEVHRIKDIGKPHLGPDQTVRIASCSIEVCYRVEKFLVHLQFMPVPDELSFTAVDIEVYGADDYCHRHDSG